MEQNNVDILIGGYTLEELKKIQTAVRKDASKHIANAVSLAEQAVDSIIEICGDYEDIEELDENRIRGLAQVAEDNLKLAELISGISGVEYYVAYDEEYREQDGTMSTRLNAIFDYDFPDCISAVMGTLESMEHQSYLWNSSSIGC